MTDAFYYPRSDFLNAIIAENIALVGDRFAQDNVDRLIEMTRDDDFSNRDWATMLLAGVELDSPAIRAALLHALHDPSSAIRGEALCGLAERDKSLAMPLVLKELMGDDICISTLMAAQDIAHPDLGSSLEGWLEVDPADHQFTSWVRDALIACRSPD